MNSFVSQLQELTKTTIERQEKAYQLEQQIKRERAIQDSNNFFNEYFSKWLIELANQGLSYILCRLDFSTDSFWRIYFSQKTIPNSRKKGPGVVYFNVPPYHEFQIEDFLNIVDNQNFFKVLCQEDMNHPLAYYCLISWGTDEYLEAIKQKNFFFLDKLSKNNTKNLNNSIDNRKQEREKLTAGLRYDILKRDNYRCQICGRTQADGVKLHVDHIVPIVKGGKTVPENLQTLCQDCNLGKGTKDF